MKLYRHFFTIRLYLLLIYIAEICSICCFSLPILWIYSLSVFFNHSDSFLSSLLLWLFSPLFESFFLHFFLSHTSVKLFLIWFLCLYQTFLFSLCKMLLSYLLILFVSGLSLFKNILFIQNVFLRFISLKFPSLSFFVLRLSSLHFHSFIHSFIFHWHIPIHLQIFIRAASSFCLFMSRIHMYKP